MKVLRLLGLVCLAIVFVPLGMLLDFINRWFSLKKLRPRLEDAWVAHWSYWSHYGGCYDDVMSAGEWVDTQVRTLKERQSGVVVSQQFDAHTQMTTFTLAWYFFAQEPSQLFIGRSFTQSRKGTFFLPRKENWVALLNEWDFSEPGDSLSEVLFLSPARLWDLHYLRKEQAPHFLDQNQSLEALIFMPVIS